MRLPHNETDKTKRYTMTNPIAASDAYTAVYRWRYSGERQPTPEEFSRVLMLAGDYLHLTTYELGQECCVRKLRDIWRAVRALDAAERSEKP
jgi:hypothetical protein